MSECIFPLLAGAALMTVAVVLIFDIWGRR